MWLRLRVIQTFLEGHSRFNHGYKVLWRLLDRLDDCRFLFLLLSEILDKLIDYRVLLFKHLIGTVLGYKCVIL